MASRMIGIEFGSSTLKMAVSVGGVIKKMAYQRMPEDLVREGRVTSPAAMTGFIKSMMKENGIRGGNCAMVLPQQLVIAHHVDMPVMNEKELMLNLPFEFRDFVGKDGAKYSYDYCVMGIEENVMHLYAAAVPKDVVEDYYAIFKKAGLTLKLAIPAEMAWQNLVNAAPELPSELCIVDLGHQSTRVNIFSKGNFIMGKDIELAGSMIDETLASDLQIDAYAARLRKEANLNKVQGSDAANATYQAITMEVMKTLSFYSYTHPDAQLEHMYYCGGTGLIEPLRIALMKNTGLTLHRPYRLVNLSEVAGEDALYCALAAGAAIQK